jgi:hypothetical protein
MSLDQATNIFSNVSLSPKFPEMGRRLAIAIAPSQTLALGQVLGVLTTNANDVQTFTATGTPTGGSFNWTVVNPLTLETLTLAIPFNCTSATLQTLANAIWNQTLTGIVNVTTGVDTSTTVNNITAGGGPWPGTPLTLTATTGSPLANMLIPIAVAGTNGLTGGSAPTSTVAHTTSGSRAGTAVAYSSTTLAAPTTGPTLTAASGSTTFVAGIHYVSYTLVTAGGESTASPVTGVVLTATQQINVTSITGLNAAVTSVNFYMDGYFVQSATVTAGATGTVNIVSGTQTGKVPPASNTAYTAPNGAGSQIAQYLLEYPVATDAYGRITYGSQTGGAPPFGYTNQAAPVFFKGEFNLGDLVGLDANALQVQVPAFGRISEGSLSSGVGTFSLT